MIRRSFMRHWLITTTALAGALPMIGLTASIAHANPQGGSVAQGSATITQTDPKTVTVKQITDKAVINWQSFSIGAGETTRFVQPSSSSSVLNRVTGDQVSQILGNLQANGRVYLVNPNGIVFGAGSKIDVAALVASTANIKDSNFMAGNLRFGIPGKANAQIINEGAITAADGGLVALVAPSLRNSGIIQARLGKVAMVGANGVTLDLYGDNLILFQASDKVTEQLVGADGQPVAAQIDNSGKIYADGGWVLMNANAAKGVVDNVINTSGLISARTVEQQGGEIVLKGEDAGVVQVAGTLDASGKEAGQTGGRAVVTGERVELVGDARADASGDSGGGTILVGGDHMGGGLTPEEAVQKGLRMELAVIKTATDVRIGADVVLDASAIRKGDGGKIVAWADNSTEFYGTALARGGLLGGDGGTVEISGNRRVVALGKVDVAAKKGKQGRYLIDPLGSLYASTADYFAELDPGSAAYVIDMHTDTDGALYVLTSKNASQVDFRTDPDGTKSYRTNIILTKIVSGAIVAQSVIDTIYGGGANGDGTARGALYVGSSGLKVFFSEKTNGFSYAQEGYVYNLGKTTLDATAGRQTLFTTANWGWNPYFDASGNVNHFSFAGYYSVLNTAGGGFIFPDAFARQMYAARLVNGDATGDANTLNNVTLSQTLLARAKVLAAPAPGGSGSNNSTGSNFTTTPSNDVLNGEPGKNGEDGTRTGGSSGQTPPPLPLPYPNELKPLTAKDFLQALSDIDNSPGTAIASLTVGDNGFVKWGTFICDAADILNSIADGKYSDAEKKGVEVVGGFVIANLGTFLVARDLGKWAGESLDKHFNNEVIATVLYGNMSSPLLKSVYVENGKDAKGPYVSFVGEPALYESAVGKGLMVKRTVDGFTRYYITQNGAVNYYVSEVPPTKSGPFGLIGEYTYSGVQQNNDLAQKLAEAVVKN